MSADELLTKAIEQIESELRYDLSNATLKRYNQVMRRWALVRASLLCAVSPCGLPSCVGPDSHLERLDDVG